ncbi:reverse transcriptase domain-containing protein [Tanacetum coccineum]|uniref:Reverse transcriptase domain-containing protein n=1 Tax=Tanacetum coccineum TaxID=301880 RepID=A0ABQ5CPD1_9ASTR
MEIHHSSKETDNLLKTYMERYMGQKVDQAPGLPRASSETAMFFSTSEGTRPGRRAQDHRSEMGGHFVHRKKDAKNVFPCTNQNLDIFAWKLADMTGVPRNIAEHRLNIREGYSPVRQKKRGQAPERNKIIQEETLASVQVKTDEKIHPIKPTSCNNASTDKAKLLSSSENPEGAEVESSSRRYDIQYRPRTAIKGQILADFIVNTGRKTPLRTNFVAEPPEEAEFTYAMRFRFEATNNEAEYEALIAGLRIAEQIGVKNLQANVDSRLVSNQVNGSYIAKESRSMGQYLNKVLVGRLKEKSINEKEILDVVEEEGNTWMTPIYEYLTKEILPEDKKKARAIWHTGEIISEQWKTFPGIIHSKIGVRNLHAVNCFASVKHPQANGLVAKAIEV